MSKRRITLVKHHVENLSDKLLLAPLPGKKGIKYTAESHIRFLGSRTTKDGTPAYLNLTTPDGQRRAIRPLIQILNALVTGNVDIIPDTTGGKRNLDVLCKTVCGNIENGRCRRDKER